MMNTRRFGYGAVTAVLLGIPLATGCGTSSGGDGGGDGGTQSLADTSSRMAYRVGTFNQNGTSTKSVGFDSAEITENANQTEATFTTVSDGIRDQKNLTRNTNLDNASTLFSGRGYSGMDADGGGAEAIIGNTMQVNGEDAFLSIHRNTRYDNSQSTTNFSGTTEEAIAYTANRTPTTTVDALKNDTATRSATYAGTGRMAYDTDCGLGCGASGAVDTTLQMTVNFNGSNAGVDGKLNVVQPAGQDNPLGLSSVTFDGDLLKNSADYSIKNIKVNSGTQESVTLDKQAGVGSFVGAAAAGTIGVFGGAGTTTDANPSKVTLQGYYTGTAAQPQSSR